MRNRIPLLAAGALAVLTACGSAAHGGAAPAPASATRAAAARAAVTHAAATCAPGPGRAGSTFSPVDASFASPSDGWLLGVVMNDCAAGAIIEARATVDGGLHWAKATAPPAPGAVSRRTGRGTCRRTA